jgi:sensor c-di-GMP phosphodiesterase-like protein
MAKPAATILMVLVAVAAVTAPIGIALAFAQRQGLESERTRVEGYARDVLHRSEATTEQVQVGIARLVEAGDEADPCSADALALMRDIDLSSSYIQAVGHVVGDDLDCSSLSPTSSSLHLGPVDYVSESDARVRVEVTFPFAPESTFLVIERSGFAAIIHKDLPIDVSTSTTDVAVASFATATSGLLTSRGAIDVAWVAGHADAPERTFSSEGRLVTVLRSDRFHIGAVASIPTTHVADRTRDAAKVLVPIGVIAGLVLAGAVIYLARLQMALPSVIRTAFRRKELFVEYQPVVDLRTGEWCGAEALVRWRRPNGELIRPDVFVPVIEASGLGPRLTRYVFEVIAREAVDLFVTHPDFQMAVNLTPTDLHSLATIAVVEEFLEEVGARPTNLVLEATERGFLDPDSVREVVRQLRQRDIRVSVDDFGTGYSSLSYLESFELDALKIDKSFVDTLGREAATSQVVFHIIEMAKALDLEIVAEGVEQESQAVVLREAGVHFAQGWLYAKPMPMEELLAGMPEPVAAPR